MTYVVLVYADQDEPAAGDIPFVGIADDLEQAKQLAQAHAAMMKGSVEYWEEYKGDPLHDSMIVDYMGEYTITYWVAKSPLINYAIVEQ